MAEAAEADNQHMHTAAETADVASTLPLDRVPRPFHRVDERDTS